MWLLGTSLVADVFLSLFIFMAHLLPKTLYSIGRLLGEAEVIVEAAIDNERNLLNGEFSSLVSGMIE